MTRRFMRSAALAALLLVGYSTSSVADQPARYDQFVVAEDVVMKYVNGELRFCQRRNLKGLICGQHTKVFGKELFEVMDWWRAETFVQAYTGLHEVTVSSVSPGPSGTSLVIYFSQIK